MAVSVSINVTGTLEEVGGVFDAIRGALPDSGGVTLETTSKVDVLHFTPPEHQGDLQLVPLVKKLFRPTDLGHVIMLLDTGSKLCFLYPFRGLFLVSLVLAQLVLVLAKLKDSANRGICAGRYLDKIKDMRLRDLQSLLGGHDSKHLAFRTDNTHLTSTNPIVLPDIISVMIPFSIFPTWFPYHVAI